MVGTEWVTDLMLAGEWVPIKRGSLFISDFDVSDEFGDARFGGGALHYKDEYDNPYLVRFKEVQAFRLLKGYYA